VRRHLGAGLDPGAAVRMRKILSRYKDIFSASNLQDHALYFDRLNISYTYIPKNGCSNLRAALGIANGTLSESCLDLTRLSIHNGAALADHVNATKLIVLRNPFQRILSAYLDKIIARELEPFAFDACVSILERRDLTRCEAERHVQNGERPSFMEFISFLKDTRDVVSNPHWRSQCSFFLFTDYDYIFPLTLINLYWETSIFSQFQLSDRIYWHRTSRGRIAVEDVESVGLARAVYDMKGQHIYEFMIERNMVPSVSSFYSSTKLFDLFVDRYINDLRLYETLFPGLVRLTSAFPTS
jgi:hypothetical protein